MVLVLAGKLARRGLGVLLVTLKGEGPFPREARRAGIPTEVLDLRKPFAFVSLVGLLRKKRPGILQCFLYVANIVGRIAGKAAGVPVVLSGQRSTDPWRKWYHWYLDRLTAPWCRYVISNSYAGRDVLAVRGRFGRSKILVIPNGVDACAGTRPQKWNVPRTGPVVVGTIGNLRRAKGHVYLVRAAAAVIRKHPETRFVIAGEGELMETLRQEAQREGIGDSMFFRGFSRPEDVLPLLDIFVLPSLWEGCPVSLLEAMAFGIPVVATSVGDVPAILCHRENGLVVPPGNPSLLADAISELIEQPLLRDRLSGQALETVRTGYTADAMAERYLQLYRALSS